MGSPPPMQSESTIPLAETQVILSAEVQLSLFELAEIANSEHAAAQSAFVSTLEHAFNAGAALIEAKGRLNHGEWLPWLEENFKGTSRIAQYYMRLAANTKRVSYLGEPSLRVALKALSTGEERDAKEIERQKKRDENKELIAQAPSLDEAIEAGASFATIVIDPPWDFGDEGDVDQFGRGRPTYQTISGDELLNWRVADLATADAHIYLWITNRSLPKGFALLEAWGFRYVTCLTWVKPSFGMGNYFRGSTEQVLFGVRGSLPLARHDVPTHFLAPRGPDGHSSKPVEFYELVASCSPEPRVNVFGRNEYPGWHSYGENGMSWQP